MAWWNDGNWAGPYDFDTLAQVLHELCWAVNEREKLLGMGTSSDAWTPWYEAGGGSTPLTKFYIKDGTEKAFPTKADFQRDASTQAGLCESGGYVALTLARLKTGVASLVTTGIPESSTVSGTTYHARYAARYGADIDTAYTLSSLLSLGSYGSAWLTVERLNAPEIWDQVREASAALSVALWTPYFGSPSDPDPDICQERYVKDSVSPYTEWADAVAKTRVPSKGAFTLPDGSGGYLGPLAWAHYTDSHTATLRDTLHTELCTKYVKGIVVDSVLPLKRYTYQNQGASFEINGVAVGAGTTPIDIAFDVIPGEQFVLDGDVIGTEPSDTPLFQVSAYFDPAHVVTDISSLLTYG